MKPISLLAIALMLAMAPLNAAEPSARLQELRAERREINRAISKAVPNTNERDPELAKLQQASIDASKAFEKALKELPSLAEFNKELSAANAKLVTAITTKDESLKEAAKKEISEVQHRRLEAAMKDPGIQEISKANQEAGAAWRARNDEVLATLPETKELTKRLNALNQEIQEELKKQRK